MTERKTLRDILLPGKIHKNTQKSQKTNYALKTIVRIIIFYLAESVLLIKIRDYQFVRNVTEIGKKSTVSNQTIADLRNIMIAENLLIVVIMTVISLGILFYCNKKMSENG